MKQLNAVLLLITLLAGCAAVTARQDLQACLESSCDNVATLKQNLVQAEESDASTWKTIGTVTLVVAVIAVVVAAAILATGGGGGYDDHPCDYSWQIAKDGSRCGNRAADMRPGGR